MKLLFKLLLIPLFTTFLFVAPTGVFADAKSDFDFQYSKYRQNIIEYTILKKDFLDNPTLDNQQKAVLAAKDAIYSRDLAKASFADYLLSLCKEEKTNFAPVKPILDNLRNAKSFFQSEAVKSKTIVTPANLLSFTQSYLENTKVHDNSFRSGVVACKISEFVRIQIESKNAFDVVYPKLATPFSTALNTRINDLQTQGNNINDIINTFTNKLNTEEDMLNINNENYFYDKIETINKIQTLQLRWIDSLIDIDLNYAHT